MPAKDMPPDVGPEFLELVHQRDYGTILTMIWINLSLLLLMQAPRPNPPRGVPYTEGVYYQAASAKWMPLALAPMADTKPKGLDAYIQTDGMTDLGMTTVFRGAHASTQFTVPRPSFFIRDIGSEADAMIIQLTQKKDTRTLQTSSGIVSVENKGGFRKGEIHKVAIAGYSDKSFSVTPENDLKPGEYLLVFGYAHTGFDFGIRAAEH